MDALDALKSQASGFPEEPGVYLMRSTHGDVLYVGKAKNLRARVRSYFIRGGDERHQIEYLLQSIAEIDYIITDSEQHAFLLERDLIFKHKPRFNIKLKDDRAYLSIRFNTGDPWPRL